MLVGATGLALASGFSLPIARHAGEGEATAKRLYVQEAHARLLHDGGQVPVDEDGDTMDKSGESISTSPMAPGKLLLLS